MKELEPFRAQIDELDEQLIDILARRFAVVRAVGEFKANNADIAVEQPVRAQAVKDRAAAMGKDKGLNPAFIHKLYDLMIDHAHELEYELEYEIEDHHGDE